MDIRQPSSGRKTVLIKKDFQLKFIMKFCSLLLAGVVISTGLLFLFSRDTLTSSFEGSRLVIKSTASAIMPAVIYTNLITLGLVAVAVFFTTMYISHKIAGPLFRFEADIREFGKGNLTTRVALRQDDQVSDVAEALNEMAENIHNKIVEIQKNTEVAIASASSQGAPESQIDEMKQIVDTIKRNFKL